MRYVLPASNEIPEQNSKYIDEGIAVPVSLLHLYCHSLSLEMTRAEPSEPSIGQTVWDAIHRRSSTTTMFLTGQLKVYKQNINTDRIAQTLISLLSLYFLINVLYYFAEWVLGPTLTAEDLSSPPDLAHGSGLGPHTRPETITLSQTQYCIQLYSNM